MEMLEHFLPGLSQVINYPLHYQVTNHTRYQRLYGKKLLWHIESLKLDFIMVIETDSLQITQEKDPQNIHLSITTDLASLIALATDSHNPKQTFTLQGDNELANLLKTYLKNLDIDWQGLLTDLLGPDLAYLIHDQVKRTHHWGKKSQQAFIRSSHDYIVHTNSLTPSKESLHNFYQQVDTLCQDLDRLEQLAQSRKPHDS